MNSNKLIKLAFFSAILATLSSPALAISPIVRSYQSVRAAGMGNVRYTTGLYEENFYANPGRTSENPNKKFQLPKFTIEAGSGALSSVKDLVNSKGGGLSAVSNSVGKPISARFQLGFPAYFTDSFISREWSMGVGVLMSAQMVGNVSQSGSITPSTVIGGGPAITIARRFLEEERLSVGVTTHAEFRATSGNAFSIIDFLKGSVASSLRGGSGMGIDFDLGATFRPHWGLGGFNYELGLAFNNLLGGKYNNLGGKIGGWNGDPTATPTSVNFGVAARKDDLWKFNSFMMALEFTDIGNNKNGSLFKTLHFGAEAQWKSIALRTGINQGYLCGGLGFDFGFFMLNASTYGEELGLNAGVLEDRRYALDFGFQI
jgi:hypothetical protein